MCVTLEPNIQSYVIMKLSKLLFSPLGSTECLPGVSFAPRKKEIIPLIAGAAIAAGSAIYGGIKSAQANRAAMQEAAEQKAKEDALLNRRRNEHYLDTVDGQRLLNQAREHAREISKRASGEKVVAGGTDASAAMAKEAGNKMVGDAMANIAAQDTARKDNIDQQQLASDRAYSPQVQAYEQQRGQAIAQAAQGVSNAAMTIGAGMSGTGSASLKGGNNAGTPTGTPQNTVPVGNLKVGGMQWHDTVGNMQKYMQVARRTSLF